MYTFSNRVFNKILDMYSFSNMFIYKKIANTNEHKCIFYIVIFEDYY